MCSQGFRRAPVARTALTSGLRRAAALERGWRRFGRARAGVTALEYALMGSLVAVAIAGGVAGYTNSLGTFMSGAFSAIAASM